MRLVSYLLALAAIVSHSIVFSATLNINARGRGDYATIDAAIDAAVDGDVIVLADGTYRGDGNRDVYFGGKAITLRSENGPDRCIIDCQGTEDDHHRGFYLSQEEGADTIIDGLTIRNAYMAGSGIPGNGSAIYCRQTSPTIQNCIIEDCYSNGGTLRLQSSNSIVINCIFRRNIGGSGAVYVVNEAPQLIDCVISDNHPDNWGGGIFTYNSDVTLTGCVIQNNNASGYGGGIMVDEGEPTMTNCVIVGNSSTNCGGGISVESTTNLTLDRCVIDQNSTTNRGAGIYCHNSVMDVENCFIRGNIGGTYGSGVAVDGTSTADIFNCVINGNVTSYGGGVHSMNSASVILESCTICGNYAQYTGGGIGCNGEGDAVVLGCILWDNGFHDESGLGSQLFAEDAGSTINVSSSDVMGGQADTHTLYSAEITWGDGNIDVDPCFVSEGQWDTNNTNDTFDDDVWSPGDYQLLADSECIDTLDLVIVEGMTDIIGNTRLNGSAIDMGAYENVPFEAITCTKLTLKAGRARPDDTTAAGDSLMINGTFEGTQADFEDADYCSLRVGGWAQTVACENFRGRAPRLNYRGGTTGIKSINLDFSKGTFKASVKGIDLTGTEAPVPVILSFGTYYGQCEAADTGAEDVINTRKNVPIQFMSGYEDTIRITRVRCQQDREGLMKSLSVQGEIAVGESIDLASEEMIFDWGTVQFTLLAGNLEPVGNGKYQYREREGQESYKVVIDLNKCTYKIDIRNTGDTYQASPVDVRLRLGGEFDQSVSGVTF